MDFAGWLRNLGLEEYEATFRNNAIDETILPDLTESHLVSSDFRSAPESSSSRPLRRWV